MLQRFVQALLNIVATPPTPSVSPLMNSEKITRVTAPSVGVHPTNQPPAVKIETTVPPSTF